MIHFVTSSLTYPLTFNPVRGWLALLLVLMHISSCSQLQTAIVEQQQPLMISSQYTNSDRIRYVGAGTASGPLLMSSMGAMGIAIGIAIDEGTAKDIQNNLNADFNFAKLVADVFSELTQIPTTLTTVADEPALLTIDWYGFKAKGDEVNAVVDIALSSELVTILTNTNMNKAFVAQSCSEPSAPISMSVNDVKTQAALAVKALKSAVHTSICQQIQ